MKQPGSDIVLGIPWLWAANPMINWVKNEIYFIRGSNLNKLYSVLNSSEGVKIFTMSAEETQGTKEFWHKDTVKQMSQRWLRLCYQDIYL